MAETKRENQWDTVTGLLRKAPFLKALDARIVEAEAAGTLEEAALLCINICNFRYYNIQYGNQAGDAVLRGLAQRVRRERPAALCGRFISDRIVVLAKREDIEPRIRSVQQAFTRRYGRYGLKLKVGIFALTAGRRAQEVCELANLACDAIRNKPETFCYYNEQINRRAENVVYLVQNLDRAIREGWIQVYYQPMIRTATDALCGVESLTRWVDPDRGLLSPADYIPVLEDNQLITKLDLYVLDRVCQDMRRWSEEGRQLVPISVNLSRIDFRNRDMVKEVEDYVRKYGLARDLLALEVTESVVMEDSEFVKREIGRFRETGYQVFMDDFGSGYSSLNVLRDYEFDEIKLDMIFLRHFDEKSKRVIRSAVSMAKGLGLQVLAEGVETQEEYEFLKDIGCDKVQGYYFSSPLPLTDFETWAAGFNKIEGRRFKRYYAQINRVNFLTDKALEIVDYDGEHFESLYANASARDVWQSMDFATMDRVFELVNDPASSYYKDARDALVKLRPGDPLHMEFDVYGTFVSLQVELLAEEGEHRLLVIEAANLGQKDEEDQGDENYIFRLLYTMYDEIYLINLKTQEFEPLKPGVNYVEMSEEWSTRDWKLDVQAAAQQFIQLEDQGDYVKFADPTTVRDRMAKADKGILTEIFRTKGERGAYVMKLHTIQPMPGSDCVLYSSQYVPQIQRQLDQKNWRKTAPIKDVDEVHQKIWQTLRHSRVMNIFWKDCDRRFVGANAKFLETYGITDPAELIGKTDEEMHWHLDDGPFREDELQVLREGKTIVNHLGKCIIRGKVHDIVVSKEPVYHDGKIVGLLGAFMPVDDAVLDLASRAAQLKADDGAQLMSAQDLSDTLAAYMEGWEFRQEKFVAISVQFHSYERAQRTYGTDIAQKMLEALCGKIADACDNSAVAGRTYGEHFLLLMRYSDWQEVADFVQRFADRFDSLHELAGHPETFIPDIRVYDSENAGSMAELVAEIYRKDAPVAARPAKLSNM